MKIRGETVFNLLLLVIFGAGVVFSSGWSASARLLPLAVSIGGVALSAGFLLSALRQTPSKKEEQVVEEQELSDHTETEETKAKTTARSEMIIILWILAFLSLVLLAGFWVAIAAFIPVFVMVFGSENVKTAVTYTVGVWVFMYVVFHMGLGIQLFGGILGLSFPR